MQGVGTPGFPLPLQGLQKASRPALWGPGLGSPKGRSRSREECPGAGSCPQEPAAAAGVCLHQGHVPPRPQPSPRPHSPRPAYSPAPPIAPSCSEPFGLLCRGETESQSLELVSATMRGVRGRERKPRRQSLSSPATLPPQWLWWDGWSGGSLGVVGWAWSRNQILPAGASPEATATARGRWERPSSPHTGTRLRHGVGSGDMRAPAIVGPWSAQLGGAPWALIEQRGHRRPRIQTWGWMDGACSSPHRGVRTPHSSLKGT